MRLIHPFVYSPPTPSHRQQLLEEQVAVYAQHLDLSKGQVAVSDLPPLDYDSLKKMPLLEYTVKETLRTRPPIVTVMRKVMQDLQFKDYIIPKGHYICASPAVSQLDEAKYGVDAVEWDPLRYVRGKVSEEKQSEWTIQNVDVAEKSARSHYLPFGAGRHR